MVWLSENSPLFPGCGRGWRSPLTVAQFSRECCFAVLKMNSTESPLSWDSPWWMPLLLRPPCTPQCRLSASYCHLWSPSLPLSFPSSDWSNATSILVFTFSPVLSPWALLRSVFLSKCNAVNLKNANSSESSLRNTHTHPKNLCRPQSKKFLGGDGVSPQGAFMRWEWPLNAVRVQGRLPLACPLCGTLCSLFTAQVLQFYSSRITMYPLLHFLLDD